MALGGTLKMSGVVSNQTGAQMFASTGNKLLMTQGLAANAGLINLTGGTFDNNNHTMTNYTQISGYGTFRSGGLSNYGTMTLSGGTTTVNGDVTNQSGGNLNIAYNPAIFTGNVTNSGQVKVTSTTVTWAGGFTNNGGCISDPATQFFSNLMVGPDGYIQGGKGDIFSLSGNFIDQSTQDGLWNTALASLVFTGGGAHQFSIPGTSLAWGTLDITGQILNLVDGDNTPGGAFYIGQILGMTLDGNLVTNIIGAPGLDIYYDPTLNPDLKGLTLNLTGGGLLGPAAVPLPASAWLFLSGLAGLGLLGRRRRGKSS